MQDVNNYFGNKMNTYTHDPSPGAQVQTSVPQQPFGSTSQRPVEPTSSQKTKKWLIPVCPIGVVVLALGTAGFFAYQNFQLKKAQTTSTLATPIPVSGLPSSTPDPTVDWTTYTNTRFNYQIKYPSDWTARSTEPGPSAFELIDNSRGFITFPNIYSGESNAKTHITIETDGPQNLAFSSYEDWLTKVSTSKFYKIESSTQGTFADVPATIVSGSYGGYGFPASIKTIHFQSADGKVYYTISVTSEKDSARQDTVNQILSTFKFTDR
jgi:hypothetical protein